MSKAQQTFLTLSRQTLHESRRDKTMSNNVFVLDTSKQPLKPCTRGMARSLLKAGKAAVFRQYPFTLILKKSVQPKEDEQYQLKLDPGSKTTGISILQDNKLIWAAELTHRGQQIKDDLESRRSLRRGRRGRKTRYRKLDFSIELEKKVGCLQVSNIAFKPQLLGSTD